MLGWFRYVCAGICAVAGVIFLLMDSNILARGAARWALNDWDKGSYAIIAFSIPWLIAILPFFIVLAWVSGHKLWSAAGFVLYIVFLAYNLVGAGGAIAMIRSDAVSARRFDAAMERDRTRERAQLATQRQAIETKKTRPYAQISALMAAEEAKPWWDYSDQCREPDTRREQRFCVAYAELKAELGAAKALEEINAKITTIDDKRAVAGWVAEIVDPQAETLAAWTGLEADRIQRLLPMANPIVLLLGSMILLGLSLIFAGFTHKELALGRPGSALAAQMPGLALRQGGGSGPAPALAALSRKLKVVPLAGITRQVQLARWFFSECARPAMSGGLPEQDWYEHYAKICQQSQDQPLSLESFREIAREYIADMSPVDGVIFYHKWLPQVPGRVA